MPDEERSRGGTLMPKKRWRLFNFIVEVAVESPGEIDEEEAAEDAADFCVSLSYTCGRAGKSFVSITRIDECGQRRPVECPVIIKTYPAGTKVEVSLPRGIDATKNHYERRYTKKKVQKAFK